MMLYHLLESIKTVIILNPWECMFTCALIFTFFGMYMEDVFKIWNWGPKCAKCDEWGFWDTSKSYCNECDDHRCNDAWAEGYAHGERGVGGLR